MLVYVPTTHEVNNNSLCGQHRGPVCTFARTSESLHLSDLYRLYLQNEPSLNCYTGSLEVRHESWEGFHMAT